MRSVKKTRVILFRLIFFDWRMQSKKSSFSTGSASRNSQSRKVESKKPYFDCVRNLELGFSRKRPTDQSDCIKNGLTSDCEFLIFTARAKKGRLAAWYVFFHAVRWGSVRFDRPALDIACSGWMGRLLTLDRYHR